MSQFVYDKKSQRHYEITYSKGYFSVASNYLKFQIDIAPYGYQQYGLVYEFRHVIGREYWDVTITDYNNPTKQLKVKLNYGLPPKTLGRVMIEGHMGFCQELGIADANALSRRGI